MSFMEIEAQAQPGSGTQPARWVRPVQALVTAVVAVGVVLALVSNLGLTPAAMTWSGVVSVIVGSPWWALPVGVAGAALVGVIMASYVAALRGARVTFCDLRWPIFGIIGLSLAIDTTGGQPLVQEMFGVSGSTTLVLQPVIGIATVALLGWALKKRVALMRAARAAAQDSNSPEVCETCIPIIPGGK